MKLKGIKINNLKCKRQEYEEQKCKEQYKVHINKNQKLRTLKNFTFNFRVRIQVFQYDFKVSYEAYLQFKTIDKTLNQIYKL